MEVVPAVTESVAPLKEAPASPYVYTPRLFCTYCRRQYRFDTEAEDVAFELKGESLVAQPNLKEATKQNPVVQGIHDDTLTCCYLSQLVEAFGDEYSKADPDTQILLLLDRASQTGEQDLPICEECIGRVLQELENQLQNTVTEKENYMASISALRGKEVDVMPEAEFEREVVQFEESKAALEAQGAELSAELLRLNREKAAVAKETADLETVERRYWRDFNHFQIQLRNCYDEREKLRRGIEVERAVGGRLASTDIFGDCFHIEPRNATTHFGTINGFRMGTLPQERVEWNEINAGWGQAALLLSTMAKKCQYTFTTYEVVPKGDKSDCRKQLSSLQPHLYIHARLRVCGISHPFCCVAFDSLYTCLLQGATPT